MIFFVFALFLQKGAAKRDRTEYCQSFYFNLRETEIEQSVKNFFHGFYEYAGVHSGNFKFITNFYHILNYFTFFQIDRTTSTRLIMRSFTSTSISGSWRTVLGGQMGGWMQSALPTVRPKSAIGSIWTQHKNRDGLLPGETF